MSAIKNSYNTITRRQITWLKNIYGQKIIVYQNKVYNWQMGLWKYAYHSSLQKCKLKLQWAIITLSLEELELKRQTIAVTDRYIVLLHFSCECTLENSNNFFKSYTYPSHTLTDSIPRYLSKKYGNIRLPLYLKSRFIHNTPELERIDAFINIWIATQIVIQVSFTFQNLHYNTLLWWNACILTSFRELKGIRRGCSLLRQKTKSENCVLRWFCSSRYKGQQDTSGSVSASTCQNSPVSGEHRGFILIYFVPVLARCVWRDQWSLRGDFSESENSQNFAHLN